MWPQVCGCAGMQVHVCGEVVHGHTFAMDGIHPGSRYRDRRTSGGRHVHAYPTMNTVHAISMTL